MRKTLVFITCLVTLILNLSVSAFAQTSTGSTRILVGLAGETPNERVQGIDVSTTHIDYVLAGLPTIPGIPIDFGNSFTRDLANEAFGEYNGARQDLESAIRASLNNINNFQVFVVELEADPFHLQLYQSYSSFGAQLGTFSLRVTGRFCLPIAGCADVEVIAKDISARADYNVFLGKFENYEVDYRLAYVNTTNQSILLSIGRILGIDNAPNSDADLADDLRSRIEGELDEIGDVLESTELFSLEKFLLSVEAYVANAPLPGLPPYAPVVTEEDRQDVLKALQMLRVFIGGPSFQGTAFQLNFVINEPSYWNGYEQSVELIASHIDTKINSFTYYTQCGEVRYSRTPQFAGTKLYSRQNVFSSWVFQDSEFFGDILHIDDAHQGMQLVAISKNALIGNLYGYASRLNRIELDNEDINGPGGFQTPYETIGECGEGSNGGFGLPF